MSTRAAVGADHLNSLARRVVALGILVSTPVLIAVWFSRAGHDPWVRWGYPPLITFLVAFAWVLLRRSRWAVRAALVALVGLEVWWALVAVGRITGSPSADAAWAALAPTPMLDVPVCLIVGFLFQHTRSAALHATSYAALVTAVLGVGLGMRPGGGPYVWLALRYGMYLGVFIVLVLVLARAKETVSLAVADAERADATASLMREIAYHDELTGLANRRRLLEELERQSALAAAHHPVSVVYLDLDHFKGVNDRLGHDAGDRVLRRAAEVASGLVRHGDLLARVGGEEFVLVAPDSEHDEAMRLAERLRQGLPDELEASIGERITASFGVVQLHPGETAASVLRRADQLMFRAKADGGDQVCTADRPHPSPAQADSGTDRPAG